MSRKINFGVALFQTQSVDEIVELGRQAESLGFTHVWIGDSQMIWREAYVTLGALGISTARVKIGTAVTNPLTRHVSVTASAFSSLHELTRGRSILGIGLGDSAVETLGLAPAKLQQLREAIGVIRALTEGREVEYGQHNIRLTHAVSGTRVPIWVGATGPKMLELAGELGDGVIMMTGALAPLVRHGLERIHAGVKNAGRERQSIEIAAWVPMSISEDDPQWAKDNVRAHVARWAIRKQPIALEPHVARTIEEIRRSYDYYGHLSPGSPQSKVVTDELVDLCTISGNPEQCLSKVRELQDCGLDQIALVVHGERRAEQLRLFSETVLARV